MHLPSKLELFMTETIAQGHLAILGAIYINLPKVLGMLVLIVPWLLAAPWVHKDSIKVRAPKNLWSWALLGTGAGTFTLWLILPYYPVGLLLYVVAVSSVLIAYLAYRNGKVSEEEKIKITALIGMGPRRVKLEVTTRMKVYNNAGKVTLIPDAEQGDPAEIRAYNLAQDLLYDMVFSRASEAHISSAGQEARVRFLVDGVAVNRPEMTVSDNEAIIQYLKPIAGMDDEQRRQPQDGKLFVDVAGSQVEIMLSTAGTSHGQKMRFKVVQEFVKTRLNELGIEPKIAERLKAINESNNGLLIVSGKAGSGVTSTLYSLLREHDAFIKQLISLEANVAVDMENITQHDYGTVTELPTQLASAIRRDPDVIMIDQCPSQEVAAQICKTAATKLVLLGVSAGDSFTALAKWVKVCGDAKTATSTLRGIVCQMLLRKLCPACREPYSPDQTLLAKANIRSEQVEAFYRPPTSPLTDEKGRPYTCPTCQGIAYYGRMAAFELLELNDELRQLIISGAGLSQIKTAVRKAGMLYLQEQALRKVIAGETSIQEVVRVSKQK